jgi:hypothetical protein
VARLAGAYADGTSDAVGASVRHPATAFGLLFFSLILPATAAGAETRPDEPPPDRGVKFSGLPTASYGTDELWGFGARLKLTDFGDGTQPPFLYSVEANIWATTGGIQSHWLALDIPHLGGSPYRLFVQVAYGRSKFQPYYGLGNGSVENPAFTECDRASLPSPPNTCPRRSEDTPQPNPDFRGIRYYQYDLTTFPSVDLAVRRSIGGPWSWVIGYGFRLIGFQPNYSAEDLGQTTGSQLSGDASAGKLAGWNGRLQSIEQRFIQRYAELSGGFRFDTRDNEFAPTRGMLHEISVRGAAHALGGESNVVGANLTLRVYQRPIPSYWRLVLALRVLADVASDGNPFYILGPEGIGGRDSVRALGFDRYQGNVKLVGNAELRWRAVSVGEFEFGAAVGVDAGRVWAHFGQSDVGPFQVGTVAGLRVAWSHHFVIRADFGISPVNTFYLDFGEAF